MKLGILLLLGLTHIGVGAVGFALGIYFLPILIAPEAPSETELAAMTSEVQYQAEFTRDRKDSDRLHWGEGAVSVGTNFVSLTGELAPGPDYKLYFSPDFVETEADFARLKSTMVLAGDVKTFNNFLVEFSGDINPSDYSTVIVWCESFGEFITSAKYR